jgi:PKD repeat protein
VAPVANFNAPTCTINVPCTFTSTSTDDDAVTGWSWDFNGDGTADATTESAAFTYATAGTFSVILTVRDAEGLTNTKTTAITIAPVTPVNTPPTAGFTFTVTDNSVAFANTSTDLDGTITYLWNFGEPTSGANNESTLEDPTHAYTVTAPATFTVTLTVTDDDGATDVETQTVSVTPAPPTSLVCTTAGVNVDCVLDITARASIQLTLSAIDCELNSQRITLPTLTKQPFGNVCSRSAGEVYTITGPTGAPMVFEAGAQLLVRFTQGTIDVGDPPVGPPAGRMEGTHPNWTLSFDDGGNPTAPGEPDFTDVVLTVQATPR